MELAIVDLARRMFESYWSDADLVSDGMSSWSGVSERVRRRWVAVAIVARPDLVGGIAVPPDHWLAGVLPVYSEREFRSNVLGEEPTPA